MPHPLLRAQLERLGLTDARAPTPVAWRSFLTEVASAYSASSRRTPPSEGRTAPMARASGEQEKLSTILASLGDGLLVLDGELRVESINAHGERILQTSADAVVGRGIEELATSWSLRDRGPFAVSKMRHHLLRGLPYRNDDAFVVADDGIVHVSLVMTPIGEGSERRGAVISVRDVTGIKLAEKRLRESEQRLQRIFAEAPSGMVRIRSDATIGECNPAFATMLERTPAELRGVPLPELWHETEAKEQARRLTELLAGRGATWQGELRFARADGGTVWTDTSIAFAGSTGDQEPFAIAIVEDRTQRRRLEVELRHAQKLESIGRLAAGVAHEINTPIQFVGSNVHFVAEAFAKLADAVADNSADAVADNSADARASAAARYGDLSFLRTEVPNAIRDALEGLDRITTIVKAMKAFGDPGDGERTWLNVNEIVRSTLVVAASQLRPVASVETEFGAVPDVLGWPSDLNQVVLNLLLNAAHAIEDLGSDDGAHGTIRIVTSTWGDGVEIAISDTGTGIPEEIRERIFDPFFTTREVGGGAGQGLSLVHTLVVDRHGGQLSFETAVGAGTTFRVRLPGLRPC